jgi:5-dehydro-2-deoxygluconokinase
LSGREIPKELWKIEVDVWKIEGMFDTDDYALVVASARAGGRTNVGVISLGRNETDEIVETWLRIGAQVPGVIGFAVGRTIFLNALLKFRSNEFTRDQAVQEIAERFVHFYKVFEGN